MRTRRTWAAILAALGLTVIAVASTTAPAAAATITSTVTIQATSGSAPPGYSYPNANIVVSGVAKPSNTNNPRQVSLWRRLSSQGDYYKVDEQTTAGTGAYAFTTQLPRNEAWAIYTVRVAARKGGNGDTWTYVSSPGVQVVQTAGPESLSLSIVSPKIVETAGRSGPESASGAAQLGRVAYVTGGAPRRINLQERNAGKYGDSYWHDLEEFVDVPANTSSTWFPRTALFASSEYRAIYHYNTGIDTASAPITGFDVGSEFSDEFGGDLSLWHQRGADHGQGFEVHDLSSVAVGGGVATLTPRSWRSGDPMCSGVLHPDATAHGQTCVVTPHIATNQTIDAPRSEGESVWMAARMKVQSGATGSGGPHSAFWTNAGYCTGGEVDIAEYMGDGRAPNTVGSAGDLGHNLYWDNTGAPCGIDVKAPAATPASAMPSGDSGEKWSANYHIYAVRWQQTAAAATYTLFVDGKKVNTLTGPVSGNNGGLILSNLVNDYENYGTGSVSGSVTLTVDWVRAWRY